MHNLTAIEPGQTLTHHLLDSLSIVPTLAERAHSAAPLRVLDVGAGGGLPGMPLAIALPAAHVTLLDKVEKKVAFLRQAQLELRLPNVDVVHARVEQLRAPPFDVILARAFATLAGTRASVSPAAGQRRLLVRDEGHVAARRDRGTRTSAARRANRADR